ncbi:Crp/Fnr family transcriptional regulator [Parafilimonas terrae]|uniref:cAMP-binding domain of CRP or a regulatory subunit of cAMP-dependent protein kinases n=1 Tax=Parafilimonas terrae TaxID=1465490 RepID=A0A1I5RL13_9BACT|nr:Crp/Fnr family transcriptional regulator [Parafilimonas terrae]SFP58616.1 cAMP-binding domain of CRP or a regulatory subunit of cAMP-dependent protein kinases [Parafilimonas terrae]
MPSRTILLREGEISRQFFFVEEGCLRAWINNNGKDLTFQFFFEGQGVSSAESFRKKIPSIFTIETIEPSVIQIMHKKDYDHIMQELNNDTTFLKEMTEIIFERQLYYVREFLSFIRDTPQQRYLNLLQQKPQVVQRVPQHYIASYLGITSVHLSRIRNKLLKENKHSS